MADQFQAKMQDLKSELIDLLQCQNRTIRHLSDRVVELTEELAREREVLRKVQIPPGKYNDQVDEILALEFNKEFCKQHGIKL